MSAAERSVIVSRVSLLSGFAALLLAPLIGWMLRVRPPVDWQEMRTRSSWPDWRATPIADWPGKFEGWLNDHFAFREAFLRAHSVVRHRWLAAPSSNVLVGRDGWLFYSGDHTVEDIVGRDVFTPDELARWRDVLEGRRAWLRERGCKYLFVIVPNKSTIYPEKLPRFLAQHRGRTRADQLVEYLRANGSNVDVLDLRGPLLQAKAQRPVYWIADSHWNGHGLALACDAIADRVHAIGAPLRAGDLMRCVTIAPVQRIDDCVDLLGMRGWWPSIPVPELSLPPSAAWRFVPAAVEQATPWKDEPGWKKPVTTQCDAASGRAALFGDSFFRAGGVSRDALGQIPLILRFQRLTNYWEWPDQPMLERVATVERPDVVIEARTERFLRLVPDDHPDLAAARSRSR